MLRLSFIVLLAIALSGRAENILAGRWEGVIQIPGRELKVVVDLAQNDGGAWTGSIIMPGLDIKGAELSEIATEGAGVAFAIKDALGASQFGAARFKGEVNAEGSLQGHFVQAGNSAEFHLTKAGPPQVESPPRSTAVARELEGEWKGDYELDGYPHHVTIKLANRAAEGASADFVVVGKRVNNLPVDLVVQEGDLFSIDSHQTGIGFEGRFNKVAGEIKGTVSQGSREAPLVLRRAK